MFIVKFQASTPWLAGRLKGLLTEVFGQEPVQFGSHQSYASGGRFYVNGSPQRIAAALADPGFAAERHQLNLMEAAPATLTTDDWPYFYQHEPGLPSSVLLISVLLVVLCLAARSRLGMSSGTLQGHFFFLGAGFMLMEVQIVSRMALLFGTTWMVNSIVIAGLLLLIVAANGVVACVGRVSWSVAYTGLFLSLLLVYVVPGQALFIAQPCSRGLAAPRCMPADLRRVDFHPKFRSPRL